jgi:hypothetical protein
MTAHATIAPVRGCGTTNIPAINASIIQNFLRWSVRGNCKRSGNGGGESVVACGAL